MKYKKKKKIQRNVGNSLVLPLLFLRHLVRDQTEHQSILLVSTQSHPPSASTSVVGALTLHMSANSRNENATRSSHEHFNLKHSCNQSES